MFCFSLKFVTSLLLNEFVAYFLIFAFKFVLSLGRFFLSLASKSQPSNPFLEVYLPYRGKGSDLDLINGDINKIFCPWNFLWSILHPNKTKKYFVMFVNNWNNSITKTNIF